MAIRFRKRPVEISAIQYRGTSSFSECKAFCPTLDTTQGSVYIPTLEGAMTVSDGDWIIQGVAGEFYPCKPDIFRRTYERVV